MVNSSPFFCNFADMVKKEFIGLTKTLRAPNGCIITLTIENDKSKFKLYKLLGLDIFEEKKSKEDK